MGQVISRTALALLVWLLAMPAQAERPPVWVVSGDNGTVYLFGSMHLLPAGEFKLGGELAAAYADSERVVLEVNLDALTPAEMAAITTARAVDPARRNLLEQLGEHAQRAEAAAGQAGINLAAFSALEPWFVGLSIVAAALEQRGYKAMHGVEQVIKRQVSADAKPLVGLETLDEQLALLDGLSAELQADLLVKSLQEAQQTDQEIQALLRAWREGDDAALVGQLAIEFDGQPDLADSMVYARNQRWAQQLESFLSGPDDSLVVVGALHLVGEQGLPALLGKRGYQVKRLPGPP